MAYKFFALGRKVLCLLLAATFLLSACRSAPQARPMPASPAASGKIRSYYLSLALRAADRVPDAVRRLSLYDRVLQLAIDAGLTDDAAVILAYVAEALEFSSSEDWYEEYSTALSRRYLNLGKTKEAVDIINQKIQRVPQLTNDMRKRLLFEEIIDICFTGGDSFLVPMRQTINAVLVLEDPGMKTEILVKAAARFLRQGLVKDSQDLLQLTLSQIGSLENPWDQAELFSRIALVYSSLRNERRTREYAQRAAAEIDAIQVIVRSQEDAAKVGLVAENLQRLGSPEAALHVVSTIEYPWIAAETLCRMGILSKNGALIDKAYETASSIPNDARRVSTLLQLDFLMAEAKKTKDVANNLVLREAELSVIPALAVDSFTSRLARLYIAVGNQEAAVKTAGRIRDAYSRSGILLSAARAYLDAGKPKAAAPLLEESRILAAGAGQSQGRILLDVSGVYLEAADIHGAIASAADIIDPYSFAVAAADLTRYFIEKKTDPAPEDLRALEDVLKSAAPSNTLKKN